MQNHGNSGPALGTHLVYEPQKNLVFNWSTFAGPPDGNAAENRFFSNFFVKWATKKRYHLIAGWDVGLQQITQGGQTQHWWHTPNLVGQLQLFEKLKLGWRFEYFHDPHNTIVEAPSNNAFQVFGHSINIDWAPSPQRSLRLEYRNLRNNLAVFQSSNGLQTQNTFLTAALAVKF